MLSPRINTFRRFSWLGLPPKKYPAMTTPRSHPLRSRALTQYKSTRACRTYTRIIKPICDRAIALVALVLLAVPMLLVGVAVFLSLGRPLLFRQRRVGLNGKVFYVLKFRTMRQDRRDKEQEVSEDQRLTHKTDKDPRHTPLGQFMRRCSLDELPQLFNILRGEMSLVGPRPELESVVAKHYPPGLEQRHLVRPGLTGLWQISARGEGHMHENGEWDLGLRGNHLTNYRLTHNLQDAVCHVRAKCWKIARTPTQPHLG